MQCVIVRFPSAKESVEAHAVNKTKASSTYAWLFFFANIAFSMPFGLSSKQIFRSLNPRGRQIH